MRLELIFMILTCILWGIFAVIIAPFPECLIISIIGGGFIGIVWGSVWNYFKK